MIPGLPHHIKQRGNRRQRTFFNDVEYAAYLELMADWKAFLRSALREEEFRDLRERGRTGRPLSSSTFLDRLERLAGRVLKPQKPGPKSKPKSRKPQTRKGVN